MVINGLEAHRLGDATHHCGGNGKLIQGSPDVVIGDDVWSGFTSLPPPEPVPADEALTWIEVICHYEDGTPAAYEQFNLTFSDGTKQGGVLDRNGFARVQGIKPGSYEFSLVELDERLWEYKK